MGNIQDKGFTTNAPHLQYTCSYCGKILYSSQYVKKHEATHTGERFKAVVCKYCGKTVEYTKVCLRLC